MWVSKRRRVIEELTSKLYRKGMAMSRSDVRRLVTHVLSRVGWDRDRAYRILSEKVDPEAGFEENLKAVSGELPEQGVRWITMEEAVRILKVPASTIRRWIREGVVRGVRKGYGVFVSLDDLRSTKSVLGVRSGVMVWCPVDRKVEVWRSVEDFLNHVGGECEVLVVEGRVPVRHAEAWGCRVYRVHRPDRGVVTCPVCGNPIFEEYEILADKEIPSKVVDIVRRASTVKVRCNVCGSKLAFIPPTRLADGTVLSGYWVRIR